MKPKHLLIFVFLMTGIMSASAETLCAGPRKMWASIMNVDNASLGGFLYSDG